MKKFILCLSVLKIWPKENSHVNPNTKCESGTQTDIHPIETNIVRTHEWNEWELRRKTISLVRAIATILHISRGKKRKDPHCFIVLIIHLMKCGS